VLSSKQADRDGEAQEDGIASTVEKVDDNEAKLDNDLAQANEEYMQQVRERLERTKYSKLRRTKKMYLRQASEKASQNPQGRQG
jgi:hypothetical protein